MQVTLEKSNTQNRIIHSAMLVFQKKGYTGASMQEIANKAEINKAMLHYYFRSKENLFNAVIIKTNEIFNNALNYPELEKLNLFELILYYLKVLDNIFKKHSHLPVFLIELGNSKANNIAYSGFISPDLTRIFELKIHAAKSSGIINNVSAQSLIINILSLSIFPYLIKIPLLKQNQNFQQTSISHLNIVQTPESLSKFILASIKS